MVTDTNSPSHVPIKVHVSPVMDTRPKHLCSHRRKKLVKLSTNFDSIVNQVDDRLLAVVVCQNVPVQFHLDWSWSDPEIQGPDVGPQ